jgi:hypothetical protein
MKMMGGNNLAFWTASVVSKKRYNSNHWCKMVATAAVVAVDRTEMRQFSLQTDSFLAAQGTAVRVASL